jgi:hypothetical protein
LYKKLDIKNNEICEETIEYLEDLILVKNQQHCRIPITRIFGDVIEMDASEYVFFDGTKLTLHVAVDKATNKIVGAWLDKQETLYGYLHVLKQILVNYGIPVKIITDNRGVFTVCNKINDPEYSKLTQFGYICEKLGIELYSTSTPQKKPLVERTNRTLQGRIPGYFSLANITDITIANEYLLTTLINKINQRFNYLESGYESYFEK